MNELYHHGIKGQKWGVRRYQNPDGSLTPEGKKRYKEVTNYGEKGGTIKKGSSLYRVSVDPNDTTYDNKKYVSTSKYDNSLWEDYMVDPYKSRGKEVYGVKYETMADIKVASATDLGKAFCDRLSKDPNSVSMQTIRSYDLLRINRPETISFDEAASVNMAAQTQLGKQMAEDLLNKGYGAVSDVHGRNVSIDPIIILDPDSKLKQRERFKY